MTTLNRMKTWLFCLPAALAVATAGLTSPASAQEAPVPVTAEVRSTLGRLDNFLHYPGVLQCFNEGKDGILRSLLEEGVSQMERCLSGGLQGSLIMDASGHVHMTINLSKDPELERSIKNGDHLRLRVEVTPFLDNEEGEQGVTPNS